MPSSMLTSYTPIKINELAVLCFYLLNQNQAQVTEEGSQATSLWDFPGGAVVKTPHFHCRVCGFNPWSEH